MTTISVDPERAPLVKWAFEAYATGEHSLVELRELLADQGLTTRPTRRWPQKPISHSQLSNVLRGPYHAGVILYKGELYPGRHDPLISKELFLRVQSIMDERMQRGQRDVYNFHWAKGPIWCERCRRNGRASRLILTEANGNGGSYWYYICRGRQQGFCDIPSLRLADVEDSLERLFGSQGISREFVDSIVNEVELALQQAQRMDQEMRANIHSKLRELNLKEERLLDLASEASFSTTRLVERLKSLQFERGDLEQKLQITDKHIKQGAEAFRAYLDLLVEPDRLFRIADDSARRGLLEAFFEQVWLDVDEPAEARNRVPVREIVGAAEAFERIADMNSATTTGGTKNRGSLEGTAADAAEEGLLSQFFISCGLSKPSLAGVPGLEPRTKESESSVLPITPYPNGLGRSRTD